VTKVERPLTLLVEPLENAAFQRAIKSAAEGRQSRKEPPRPSARRKLEAGPESDSKAQPDYDLRVIRFGPGWATRGPFGAAARQGSRHPLIEALTTRAARTDAAASGIVVFSDGPQQRRMKSLAWRHHRAPGLPVGPSAKPKGYRRDARQLGAPELPFAGRQFQNRLTLQAFAEGQQTRSDVFNRGKNLIPLGAIAIRADPFEQKGTISFTPKELGPIAFSGSWPGSRASKITQNNPQRFKSRGRRDKIPRWTVVGSPAWKPTFLRMAMKQEHIDRGWVVRFLRTPTGYRRVTERKIS